MDRKAIVDAIYKNRFLILICTVLILGTLFGIYVLKILPENICRNLYGFISENSNNFANEMLNRFSFPFIILTAEFFAGFSLLGKFTSPAATFINGVFFGFENGLKYMFLGKDFITSGVISYFTSTLYFGFFVILMAEASVCCSKQLYFSIKNSNTEKTLYNAKKQTVKFITFTLIIAVFSAFSAFISCIIR